MTTEFQRAKLQEVKANKNHDPIGDAVEVQFNPASLRLRLSNKTEGGRSSGRTKRQHNGTNPAVLTMELIFDTADEFNGNNPVSVQTRTGIVEKYVFPKKKSKNKPPLLQFQWDAMIITGIVESLDLDFDHFAPNGTPLRAKCSLSIKEQKPEYQYNKEGPGARDNDNAAPPLMASINQPGYGTNQPNRTRSDRSAAALNGETAAEFAARMGLDPSAWRGLDVDLSAGLSLQAGVEIGFSADLSLAAGVGVTMGMSAGIDLSLEASVGLDASVGVSTSVAANINANTAAGFAMSAAGGVTAAIESVKVSKVQTASNATLAAFSQPATTVAAASTGLSSVTASGSVIASGAVTAGMVSSTTSSISNQTEQQRSPLVKTGAMTYTRKAAARSAPLPVTADKRAASYGFGVPLRPQYKTMLEQSQPRLYSHDPIYSSRSGAEPTLRKDPATSPWVQLPRQDAARNKADIAQRIKNTNPCRYLYKG